MIKFSVNDDIWTIRLSRPDKANALTAEMLEEICSIVARAHKARAMIVTGEGQVFSAGADLEAVKRGLATSNVWERASRAIAELPCLTIAALNGTLAGGAFGIALACDLRISVPTAKFFYPVMKLGYLPQPSDPARMSALIGPARTKLILMAGQKLNADEALLYGLIDCVCPYEELLDSAHALTDSVHTALPNQVKTIKQMCTQTSIP
ncbi:MAG: enoyl-CoA hydratase [Rhodobacteraceae bacterium]|nr:enoyl-CoA hydratase [Paracoccaceae bacterium]